MTSRTVDMNRRDLEALARRIRQRTLAMIRDAKSSHVGGCFSAADLLAVLYGNVLRIDPASPGDPDRDRFVVSKGHIAAAVYATLAETGFVDPAALGGFYQDGTLLAGHVTRGAVPGIEVSTGSLGHGLGIACGMALAARRGQRDWRTYCLLSDGECDEGSTWEAVMLAAQLRLDNLVAIVDYNKIQSLGSVAEVIGLEPFADKWRAFGWAVQELDGHDVGAIEAALRGIPSEPGRPTAVVAHTIKGKGVSFMEDQLLWHYRAPQGDEYARAAAELSDDRA